MDLYAQPILTAKTGIYKIQLQNNGFCRRTNAEKLRPYVESTCNGRTSARRHCLGFRSLDDATSKRTKHPRSHRIPKNRGRQRPIDGRPLRSRRIPTQRTSHQTPRTQKVKNTMENNSQNQNMKCPKCGKEMVIKKQDISHDSKNNKQYNRTVYWCEQDDVWGNIEIPKKA